MASTLTVALGTPPANGRPDYRHLHRGSILNRNPSVYGPADRALMAALGPHASRCFIRWEHYCSTPWELGDPMDFAANSAFTLTTPWAANLPDELIICQEGLIDLPWVTVNSAWLAQQANQDLYEDMQFSAFQYWKTERPELRWVGMLNEPDININGGWSGADIYRLLKTTIKAAVRVNNLGLPGPPLSVLGPEAIHTFVEATNNPKAPGFCAAIAADGAWWNSTGKPNMGGLSLHTFANQAQIDRLVTMTGTTGYRGLDLAAAATTLPTMFDGIPRVITAYSRESGGANPDDIVLGDGKGPDEQPTTLKMAQQSAFYVAFDELCHRYEGPAGDRIDYAIMFSETNYVDPSNTLLRAFSQAGNYQLNGGAGWVDGTRTPVYNAAVLRRQVASNTDNGVRHQVTGTGPEWANSVPNTNSGVFMAAQAVTQPGIGKVWCLLARVRNTSNLTPQNITVQWDQLASILKTTDPITVDAWRIDRDTSMMSPVNGQNGDLDKIIDGALLTIPGAGMPSTLVQMPDPSIVLIELTGTSADGGGTEFGSAALTGSGTVTATATITARAAATIAGAGSLVGSAGGTTHIGAGIIEASATLDGGTPTVTAVAAADLEVISELDASPSVTASASLVGTATLTALPVLDGPAVAASQLSLSVADTTQLTLAKAGSHQPGDLAVLVIASDDATTTVAIDLQTPPPGWAGVSRVGNATSDAEVGVFVRRAQVGGEVDGTDLPETVAFTAPVSSRLVGWWIRVVGAGASPVHALGSGAILDATTTLTVPGATTTEPATLVLLAVATDGGDTLPWSIGGDWGSGSPWPADLTGQSVNLGGATGIGAGWMVRPVPSPGSTGDAIVTTVATDGMTGLQVAFVGPVTVTASATLVGESTVTAAAVLAWEASATLTGESSLAATPAGGAQTPVVAAQLLTTNGADATSIVMAKAAPMAVGDVAVLVMANDDTAGSVAFQPVAGWDLHQLAGNATSDAEIAVYMARAEAGAEADGTNLPATVTVTTAALCRMTGWWLNIRGVAATTSLSFGSNAVAGAAPLDVPGASVLVAEALVLLVAATDGGDTLPWSAAGTGWPGSWPSGTLAGDTANVGGATGVGAGWLARPYQGPGVTDLVTLSTGALDGIAAFQMAITGVSNVVTASATLAGDSSLTVAAFVGDPPPVVQAWAVATSTGPEPQLVLTKPEPFAVGDLAVLVVFTDDDESGFGIDTPAGWTYVDGAGTTASDAEVAVFVRFAAAGGESDGTDLPGTVTVADVSPTPGRHGGYWLRLTGADGGVSVVGTRATVGNAATLAVPSLTTPTPNNLVLLAVATDGGDTLPWAVTGDGWPGSWPADLSGQSIGLGAGTGVGGGWVTTVAAEAGPVAAPTVGTSLSDGISAVQLAIAPTRVPQLVEGDAALAGAATLTTAAIRSVPGAAALPATLALVAAGGDTIGAAVLTTGLTASAAAVVTIVGASALGQALTATTAGARQFDGTAALPAELTLIAEPDDVLGAVTLPVTLDVDATPAGDPIPGDATMPADLAVAVLGIVERSASVTLSTAWATSAGTAVVLVAGAALAVSLDASADPSGIAVADATLTATATVSVVATVEMVAAVTLLATLDSAGLGGRLVSAAAVAPVDVFLSVSAPGALPVVALVRRATARATAAPVRGLP